MFSNESSSDEISTKSSDAFVQNHKEPAEHRDECGGVAAATSQGQGPPTSPVDQVPVSRDIIRDSGSPSRGHAAMDSAAAAMMMMDNRAHLSTPTQHSYSKDDDRSLSVVITEGSAVAAWASRIVMHTAAAAAAAGPCDPKSEVEASKTSRRDLIALPSAMFSASVIFPSSRCGEASPSLGSSRTSQEAQQGSNASHLGSSSSNSLHRAQSHKPLDTQAKIDPNTTSQVQIQTASLSSSLLQSSCSHSHREGNTLSSPANTINNVKNDDTTTTSDGPQRDRGALTNSLQDKFSLSNIPRGHQPSPSSSVQAEPPSIVEKEYRWWSGPASNAGWGIPRGLGLRGGGESSLNNGTSNWGTPPSASTGSNPSGWGQNAPSQNNGATAAQGQWGGAGRPGAPNQGPNGQPNPGKGSQSPQQQQATTASGGQPGNGSQQPPQQPSSQQPTQPGNGSGTNQQPPPQNGSPSWAQAAGGAGGGGGGGGGGPGKGPGPSAGGNGGGTSTSKQLEQLNTMREALFSQDGWGGQHVNQDTGWDIPGSPEPGGLNKDNNGPVWKPNVNNGKQLTGTDLWEANLRNGGQPPPQAAKTPWGHTPATNIGGTWGEDDDVGDGSNVWHGVPSSNNPPNPQWGGGGGGGGGNGGGGGGGNGGPNSVPKKENDWGGSNWGDPNEMQGGMRGGMRGGMMDPRSGDRGDMRGMNMDMRGNNDMVRSDMMMRGDPRAGGPDPRMGRMNGGDAPMWGGPKNQQPPGNQWAGPPPKDMKNSGWEEPSPPAQRRNIPNYDDGTSLWAGQQQPSTWRGNKHDGNKVSHWKEIPTPNMGGRGGQGGMQCPPGMAQGRMPGSGVMKPDGNAPLWSHPNARNGSWGDGPGGPHDGPGWADEGPGKMGGGWNDQGMMGQGSWGGPKPKNPPMQGSWGDGSDVDPSSWVHPKPGPKPLTKELVWASKQFRMLSEMGYKKEEVENALRASNMNLEDALECLHAMNSGVRGSVDGWRPRPEEHAPFDLGGSGGGPHPGGPGYPGQRYNPNPQMPFAPPGPGVNNTPSLMNNANNPNLGSINTMSPAIVQKILTQQPPPAAQQPAQQSFQSVPRNPQSQPQPSTAQLRMLVQQIQMAVQAGYLNHQILNQPLAPQTLLLLNQLLQQIKLLQTLLQQQGVAQVQPLGKGQSTAVLQISVQITKTKQQITNLQNQIAAQQAIYVKQQQHQQHITAQGPQTGDYFKPPMPDAMAALHGNFAELSMKEPQQSSFQTQQSRLTQWKLPSLDKDGDGPGGSEFDRAPGTTTKSQSHTSPNMNPLLAQGDRYAQPLFDGRQSSVPWAADRSTWSSVGRSGGDSGWPDSSASGESGNQADGKDWPNSSAQSSAAFTDLVPEFEPGKPWKGNQMKSIEDDPSITPGSVVRSSLSIATIKDTEIFGSTKTSPPASVVSSSSDNASIPSLSLSSSTWSFNPPSSSGSGFVSPLGKLGGASKGTWGEAAPPTPASSELWGAPPPMGSGKSPRGPPPGLSAGGNNKTNNSNGWGSLASNGSSTGRGAATSSAASWGGMPGGGAWGSPWLLLRNLTPQIDGSTLKTLCVQHGPLQNFHLYLNHGIALAKYQSREEAAKAQGALNNCVLGNTTIFAESPAESEVHNLLQHLHTTQPQPPGPSVGGSNWGAIRSTAPNATGGQSASSQQPPQQPPQNQGPTKPPPDAWGGGSSGSGGSQLWPSPSASSLWGAPPLDGGDQHRATPSSLNSFLPGDLLGEGSM